ncbi:hypothetical protein RI129_009811 [Pyrocoelia pectoralis]|uniref:Aminopeptidase n=1 Tax=Pyrocoelia pectoralis TaxID=417401 RepID=A0AAN7VCA8_9COLE
MLLKIIVVLLTAQVVLTIPVKEITYRLPQEVKPITYYLEMKPDFETDSFSGSVVIFVEAMQSARTITMHQYGLTMPPKENIKVYGEGSIGSLQIESVGPGESESQQFFVITLATPLVVGVRYVISIPNFKGSFNTTDLQGFYYAKYIDGEGNQKTFATTHFQPVGARRAFPCFDEPALKARFRLTVIRPSSVYMTVSNTPLDHRFSSGLKDVFKPTEVMSSYLLTIIVSEMVFSETVDRHRILAPAHDIAKQRHAYSLNRTVYILAEMENYVKMRYTFEKLDHAYVPRLYYAPGAMENWGLITYRSDFLMVSLNSQLTFKRRAATIISHEIAHQWFGNLVSPQWWEHVWLSEGFANYFEHYLADKVNDTGAIVRMLENVLSTPVFREGLILYLYDKQYQGAVPSDLYRNLQKALDGTSLKVLPPSTTVADFLGSWDSVKGFPVVTITRNYGSKSNNVHLKQRVFHNTNNQTEPGKWMIPINYATKLHPSFSITTPDAWLTTPTGTITVPDLQDDEWLIVNKQQTGYYRVNYDERNWGLIADTLRNDPDLIHPLSRAKLVYDCRFLMSTEDISPAVCGNLETYAVREYDANVWTVFKNIFASLDNKFYYLKSRSIFKKRVIHLIEGIYQHLSFEEKSDDTPSDKENRADILFWLCKMDHNECKIKSLSKFTAWKNGHEDIPVALQAAVLCGAMRNNNERDFEYVFDLFTKTEDYELKTRLGSGLACTKDENSLERILKHSMDEDSMTLFEHVSTSIRYSSKVGLETVLNFITHNFDRIEKMFGSHTKSIVEELATQMYSSSHLKRFQELRARETRAKNIFGRVVAVIADNVAWLNRNEDKLLQSLRS